MKMQNHNVNQMGCGPCPLSRRSFLATGCAGCAGMLGLSQGGLLLETANAAEPTMTVKVIFALHADVQAVPDWPNIGFDFNPVMERTMNALKNGCKGVQFVSAMANGPDQAKSIINDDEAAENIDGYIVMQMNCWNDVIRTVVDTGKPVIYADFLYAGSGGFLVYTARHLRANHENFAFMTSGRVSDLVAAANCFPLAIGAGVSRRVPRTGRRRQPLFARPDEEQGGLKAFTDGVAKVRTDATSRVRENMRCREDKFDVLSTDDLLAELKSKKMLEFERGWVDTSQSTKESLGIDIVQRPFSELNDLWEKADKDEAQEIVKRWHKTAASIIDVNDDTLEASARMYLAMKTCLKNHDACGITINCLGGFYGKHIFAYPCLGFHELLNEGLIGACECDTLSTLTMVAMTTLTKGRPGYISDPVMDVASKQIIYAHCVASNKAFGPKGPKNPFTIMTHSEDRAGASLRSTLPLGYMTTTLMMGPHRKEILFHMGKTVANSTEDRACRTKIAAVPVGDFEKLFREWDSWGWHRVTYYGDLREPVFALADRLGWKVIEEA